ncbi:helix-turn-helix domain-containing protein [Acidimicrobiia bacterium EGI L10123]|uniref:helix-turn-helix domain-containing protein n=1 Tax=Salinilacustrithrix flava TaxID=2957203 RepID=UPI003D7C2F74|nr:helix-turn-helix domain-containing protein [Acidimicrobiia bacterium EGI L10123]
MAEFLDLAEAADELGVHYQTAYRWVREGRLTAERVGRRWRVPRSALADATAEPPAVRVREIRATRHWPRLQASLQTALIEGDELRARAVVGRLHREGETLRSLVTNLIAPTMAAVGQGWREGQVTIAQEHRATAIVERLLASLDTARPGRPRGRAVVASPSGDQHGLPVAMAAAALREDGWAVDILGRDVPAETLAEHARTTGADLAVLTVTNPEVGDAVDHAVDALRAVSLAVLVGRPGATLDDLVNDARTAGPA